MSGVAYYHPWGVLFVHSGFVRVDIHGRPTVLQLPIDDSRENISTIEAMLDSAFEAGRKAELKHIRETLGIRD